MAANDDGKLDHTDHQSANETLVEAYLKVDIKMPPKGSSMTPLFVVTLNGVEEGDEETISFRDVSGDMDKSILKCTRRYLDAQNRRVSGDGENRPGAGQDAQVEATEPDAQRSGGSEPTGESASEVSPNDQHSDR